MTVRSERRVSRTRIAREEGSDVMGDDTVSDGPVLVAVDFSEDSKAALLWAARQASLEKVPLVVLHVVHDPASSPGFYRDPDEDTLRPMTARAEEMLDAFLEETRSEHGDLASLASAETKLVPGLPAGRIIEVAEDINARVVVTGSRGRTGLHAILLGSVAERVVQICKVPVVVVKSTVPEDEE